MRGSLITLGFCTLVCFIGAGLVVADPPPSPELPIQVDFQVGTPVFPGSEYIVWHGTNGFPVSAAETFVEIESWVGSWVYFIGDARLKKPDGPSADYDNLIAQYPFLKGVGAITLTEPEYEGLPELHAPRLLFDQAIAEVKLEGPSGNPEPSTVRGLWQPVIGPGTRPTLTREWRRFYGDSVTWIADGAEARLELWRERGWYREDDSYPETIDSFAAQFLWESLLIQKDETGEEADIFFRTKGDYDKAVLLGLELVLQAMVMYAPDNDPAAYSDATEPSVPGLSGIETENVFVGLSQPIVIHVRLGDGQVGPPDAAQTGEMVWTAGKKVEIALRGMMHKTSGIVYKMANGLTVAKAVKWNRPGTFTFQTPLGVTGVVEELYLVSPFFATPFLLDGLNVVINPSFGN